MTKYFLEELGNINIESNEVAKFLQGKSFAEMRSVLKKVCVILRRKKVELNTKTIVT